MGLWVGDGLTSIDKKEKRIKHIGFGNNDEDNLSYFISYLKRLKQKPNQFKFTIQYGPLVLRSRIIHLKKQLITLNIEKRNIFEINLNVKELSAGANGLTAIFRLSNSPLALTFTEIINNLEYIIKNSSGDFQARFLAGLFSAEGSAIKRGQRLQFAATRKESIALIECILNKLGFMHIKSDKNSVMIGYNKENRGHDFSLFAKLILDHIPSEKKKKECVELIKGYTIRNHDIIYFSHFVLFPESTIKDLATNFNISRCNASSITYSFLNQDLLYRLGSGQGKDPFIHSVTKEGLTWFKKNNKTFKYILSELNRLNYYKKCFKKKDIKIFDKINKTAITDGK